MRANIFTIDIDPSRRVRKISLRQVAMVAAFCCIAVSGYGQENMLERKVDLSLRDVTLKQVLAAIDSVTGIKFAYNNIHLEAFDEKITVEATAQTLGSVLDELLTPRHIAYKQERDKGYIILDIPGTRETGDKARPVPETINGVVTDLSGSAMPGVNVLIKGTTRGTTTDVDGHYTIGVMTGDLLVFSFIGYKAFETAADGRSQIDVVMEDDITRLNEVVVSSGYWEVNKKENTGNIAKVTGEEIAKQSVSNPLAALTGRMTGVFITQRSGVPGGSFAVQIRGQNSVRPDGNEPLLLVNGVPYPANSLSGQVGVNVVPGGSLLNMLNPADIESIEILKDADATAIYGSRGANGVIRITTKKGAIGKTKLDIRMSAGVGSVPRKMKLLNTAQYLEMRNEAFANDQSKPGAGDVDVNGAWEQARYTDWQEVLLGGTAHTTGTQLSISGGNEHTQFLMSGSYWKETTVYPGDFGLRKGSGHFNLNHTDDSDKFSMNVSAIYSVAGNNLPGQDLAALAISLPPNAPDPYDSTGALNWAGGTWDNPFSYVERPYEGRTTNLTTNARLNYSLGKGLELRATLGYSAVEQHDVLKSPASKSNPLIAPVTYVQVGNGTERNWIVEPQAEYQRPLFSGELSLLAGATLQEKEGEMQELQAYGFPSEALINDINAADVVEVVRTDYSRYLYAGVFARIHYSLDNKYFVNLTARRDGSSRFGAGNRFGNFGAAGAAWIFSRENFIKHKLSFMSFGKLRASYGITGSDQIGDYQYLDTYSPTIQPYRVTGLLPTRLANPDYAWEVNKKFEAALELGFWQDRVELSASWFFNRSENQILPLPLPFTTGFYEVQINSAAAVRNTGLELELDTRLVNAGHFTWTTALNITLPRSKVLAFPHLQELFGYPLRFEVGQPYTISKHYTYLDIDPGTGEYRFRDVNSDGVLSSPEDRNAFADLGPRLFGGLGTTLQYKGWELDLFFQFVRRKNNDIQYYFPMPGTRGYNQPVAVMDRWQEPGDEARYMKFSRGSDDTNYRRWTLSDDAVTDVSFVRLRNVSLSWELPARWTGRLGLQRSSVYVRGQNLWVLTGYKGADPESSNPRVLPLLRVITTGIQLSF